MIAYCALDVQTPHQVLVDGSMRRSLITMRSPSCQNNSNPIQMAVNVAVASMFAVRAGVRQSHHAPALSRNAWSELPPCATDDIHARMPVCKRRFVGAVD